MVLDAVANFVRGNTDAAVDSTQTTISVVDASIFPDPASTGDYNVVIWDASNFPRPDQDTDVEVMRVTATDTGTNDLTVTRAQEGTTGAAHPSGSAIHLSPTAKMFSDIESTFGDFWDAGAQELTADVNNPSIATNVADITGETYIKATRNTTSSANTAGVYVNIVDTEVTDVNGEFNGSFQFVPNTTADYLILAQARVAAGANGDEYRMRVRNVTDGTTALFRQYGNAGGAYTPDICQIVELTAGKAYELQVTNQDSTFDVDGDPTDTRFQLLKSVVHA